MSARTTGRRSTSPGQPLVAGAASTSDGVPGRAPIGSTTISRQTASTQPIHEYPHGDAGCSISGGVRYRGAAIPALVGWYVYGDYCSSQVRALKIEGTAVTNEVVIGEASAVSAVSEGPDGELFVVTLNGPIYAVTPPA